MEEISDSSVLPSPNQFKAELDHRLPSTVCLKERKSKATSLKSVCSQEQNAFPVRPLRRKDSLASHTKEISDGSVECSTVNFPDGLLQQSPEAQISKEDVQPQEHACLLKRPAMTPPCKSLQEGVYTTQASSVTKKRESLQDSSFSCASPDQGFKVFGDLKPTRSCPTQFKVCPLQSVNKPPEIPYDQNVHFKERKRHIGSQSHVDDFPEEHLGSSSLPKPKPRTKKHPMDDDLNQDVPNAGLPSDKESGQQGGQLILPVPLPRAKKRLSASYSGSTQNENRSIFPQIEVSAKNTTATLTSKETIQGGGSCISEVEREVLAAMAEEEFTYSDSQEEARDDLMDGWTFTDQCGVFDHFEQEEKLALPDAEMVLDTDIDKSFPGDDWLCIASDKDVDVPSKNQVKCEEVDFGFVSIEVAAGSEDDQR